MILSLGKVKKLGDFGNIQRYFSSISYGQIIDVAARQDGGTKPPWPIDFCLWLMLDCIFDL